MGEEPPSTGVGQKEEREAVSGNARLAEYAMDSALRSYQYCSPVNTRYEARSGTHLHTKVELIKLI